MAIRLFKVSRSEFWIFMAAFASVLILGTIYGVVVGIVLSFAEVVLRASKPPRAFLGVIPGHENFYDLDRNSNARPIEHTIIYKFSGNLFFANISSLQEDIENALNPDTKCVIIHAGGISSIDITAADRIGALYASLKSRGIKFYMTEHIADVNDQMQGLISRISLPRQKMIIKHILSTRHPTRKRNRLKSIRGHSASLRRCIWKAM